MFERFRQAKYIQSRTGNQINGCSSCLDNSNKQSIYDYGQEIKSIIVNISYMYSKHNSNIKCVDLIIKCINFESFYYAINLNIISFSMVFSNFDYMFLSMY